MRKLLKERKLFEGGNYMRKYGNQSGVPRNSFKYILLKMVSSYEGRKVGYSALAELLSCRE